MKPQHLFTLLAAAILIAATGCDEGVQSEKSPGTQTPDTMQTDNSVNTPGSSDSETGHAAIPPQPTPPALDFEMPALDGTPVNLADYQGRVVLIVNTASRCGLTPQYEQLQQLHEQYADDGLVILGFPANNFGAQEPGSDDEIAAFCEENYGVGFPMFSKISVKGGDQHPLYAYLTQEATNPGFAGEITWNFEKFLLDRQGHVVARFEPRTTPDDPDVLAAIQAQLDKPAQP